MTIVFTKHARAKFAVLRRHGIRVTEEMVIRAVERPEAVDHARAPLRIAQTTLDAAHVLRVIYRTAGRRRIIITFYPGRITQYGNRTTA
ncbi:DUF4258 domain-containing protein [Candidatus Uhrbacteria bacterium]|nr:DUF4258 domain-containing protein [Candidatus Uhrbacteria bacterium]